MKLFIYLFVLLLASCTHKEVQNALNRMETTIPSTQASINLSEFASSVKCIPLAAQDSVAIGELLQVVVRDKFVYATDGTSLYKFSLAGDLVSVVSHKGSSPIEYVNVSDFQIDEDGSVWVLSRNNRALFNYLWDGSLCKKIQLDAWLEKFYIIGGSKMLLYAGNEKDDEHKCALYLLDVQTEKIVNGYLPINDDKSAYLHIKSANHFSFDGETGFFYQMFNDTVYELNKECVVSPKYLLSFAGKNIPNSFYEQKYANIMEFFQILRTKDYAYGTGLFVKKDNLSLYSFYYDRHAYWHIAKDGEERVCNVLKDDVCLSGYEMNLDEISYFVQEGNQIAIPLYPYAIMEYAESKLDERQKEELLAKLKYAGEDQNPVLMIIGM